MRTMLSLIHVELSLPFPMPPMPTSMAVLDDNPVGASKCREPIVMKLLEAFPQYFLMLGLPHHPMFFHGIYGLWAGTPR